MTSAKRFNQSRLDFLPEQGYVYICYSILKPSNCVLSCTPSHTLTFVWLVWLHRWQLALPTPHELILTCWLKRCSIRFWQPMLERCRQSCFPRCSLLIDETCVSSEQRFESSFETFFFLRWDLKCFCVWFAWFSGNLIWFTLVWGVWPLYFSSYVTFNALHEQVVWLSIWHW